MPPQEPDGITTASNGSNAAIAWRARAAAVLLSPLL
jgi:hypothetical protein